MKNLRQRSAIVSLTDIAGKVEEATDFMEQYMNRATGDIEALFDGSYIEPDEELVQRIEEAPEEYVRLPNQRDIHEYGIMEAFAKAQPDERKQAILFRALCGRKPFRRFKDAIIRHGIDEGYYAFRYLAYVAIAKEWCEANDIPFQ